MNAEELGCVVKLLDRHGDGDIKADDMRRYLATLNIKKESEILDELSPIPTIKAAEKRGTSEKKGDKGIAGERGGEKRVTFELNRH